MNGYPQRLRNMFFALLRICDSETAFFDVIFRNLAIVQLPKFKIGAAMRRDDERIVFLPVTLPFWGRF